ncbi:hypothetical protein KF840_00040 [bacterium]|nr:hypothetical protein [bacterium]
MQTVHTQITHLIADGGAMWCVGAVAFASVQVVAPRANKVRTTIRPAATGGPAGGIS